MPPGRSGEIESTVAVVRNMLLAHGAAYQALHEEQALARVGIAHHMRLFQPLRAANPFDFAIPAQTMGRRQAIRMQTSAVVMDS